MESLRGGFIEDINIVADGCRAIRTSNLSSCLFSFDGVTSQRFQTSMKYILERFFCKKSYHWYGMYFKIVHSVYLYLYIYTVYIYT